MLFVYTTCREAEDAEKLSKLIIDNKFAASVDFWPARSCRRRNNETTIIEKNIIMISTFEKTLKDLDLVISENHQYSPPMIAGVDVRRINFDFKEWMTGEII